MFHIKFYNLHRSCGGWEREKTERQKNKNLAGIHMNMEEDRGNTFQWNTELFKLLFLMLNHREEGNIIQRNINN